jgi:hypothetical protein
MIIVAEDPGGNMVELVERRSGDVPASGYPARW